MQGAIEKRGAVGIAWFDNPPVNAISHEVRQGLMAAIDTAISDHEIKALIIACRGRTFMAGADITEFGSSPKPPGLPDVVMAMSESPILKVAAIFGTTLGGGFETALACDYRIAQSGSKVGLPEVKLGILAGAHGTQRLPRVANVEFALKVMTSGEPVTVEAAQEAGAVDRVTTGDLIEEAVKYAEELIEAAAPRRPIQDMTIDKGKYNEEYFAQYRESIARKTRGLSAPERSIRCVEAAVNLPFAESVWLSVRCHWRATVTRKRRPHNTFFLRSGRPAKCQVLLKMPRCRSIDSVALSAPGRWAAVSR